MKFNMENFIDKSKRQLDDRGIYNKEISEATENRLSQKGYPKSFIAQNSKNTLEDLAKQKMSYAQFKKLATPAQKVEIFEPINILPVPVQEPEQVNTYDDFFNEDQVGKKSENYSGNLPYKEPIKRDDSIFSGVGLDKEFPNEYLNEVPHISPNMTLSELFSREMNNDIVEKNPILEKQDPLIGEDKLEHADLQNPEFNKRLNQLKFLQEHLENEGARKALAEIIELLKNEPNFFDYIKKFQHEQAISKSFYMTNKPYSLKSIFSTVVGSVGAGGFTLFGQVFAGMKGVEVVHNAYGVIFLVAAMLYGRATFKYEKTKKENNAIMKSMEGVSSLFDKNLINYLCENYKDELRYLHTRISVRDFNKPEYQSKINEFIHGHKLPKGERKTYNQVIDEYVNENPEYKEYKNQLRILENLKNILEKDDTDSVLPTLSFINRFTNIVNDIYKYGGEGKNVPDIAKNIADTFIEKPKSIKNPEIARLLIRCGLKTNDDEFNRNLFSEQLHKILRADTVKFIVDNDPSVKLSLFAEMKQEVEHILPINDEIIHAFFAHDVDNATKSYDLHGEYRLGKKSNFDDLRKKILESDDNSVLREGYISEYMQKCEFDEMQKAQTTLQRLKKIPGNIKKKLFGLFAKNMSQEVVRSIDLNK